MNLQLTNVRTVQADGGTRLLADLITPDFCNPAGEPFTVPASCWADLLNQWDDPSNADPKHLIKKYLVKEAVQATRAKLADKKAALAQALADAQAALPPEPVAPAADAPQEVQDAYRAVLAAYQEAQARLTWAQNYQTTLGQFETAMAAEIPIRVDSFYNAMLAHYQGDPDRQASIQTEWDAWQTAHPDVTGLEGAVNP